MKLKILDFNNQNEENLYNNKLSNFYLKNELKLINFSNISLKEQITGKYFGFNFFSYYKQYSDFFVYVVEDDNEKIISSMVLIVHLGNNNKKYCQIIDFIIDKDYLKEKDKIISLFKFNVFFKTLKYFNIFSITVNNLNNNLVNDLKYNLVKNLPSIFAIKKSTLYLHKFHKKELINLNEEQKNNLSFLKNYVLISNEFKKDYFYENRTKPIFHLTLSNHAKNYNYPKIVKINDIDPEDCIFYLSKEKNFPIQTSIIEVNCNYKYRYPYFSSADI